VNYGVERSPDVAGDDRESVGIGLEEDDPESLASDTALREPRGHGEHMRSVEPRVALSVWYFSYEAHMSVKAMGGGKLFEMRSQWAVTYDYPLDIRDALTDQWHRPGKDIVTFVPVSKSRHGYHHWLRSALDMRGSGQVHAVRNAVQSAWFGAGSDRELARVGAHGYDCIRMAYREAGQRRPRANLIRVKILNGLRPDQMTDQPGRGTRDDVCAQDDVRPEPQSFPNSHAI